MEDNVIVQFNQELLDRLDALEEKAKETPAAAEPVVAVAAFEELSNRVGALELKDAEPASEEKPEPLINHPEYDEYIIRAKVEEGEKEPKVTGVSIGDFVRTARIDKARTESDNAMFPQRSGAPGKYWFEKGKVKTGETYPATEIGKGSAKILAIIFE